MKDIPEDLRILAHENMTEEERTEVSILQLLDGKYTQGEALAVLYAAIADIAVSMIERNKLQGRLKRKLMAVIKSSNKEMLKVIKEKTK